MMRVLRWAALAIAGLALGIIGGFVQADRAIIDTDWGVIAVPWGAVLMLLVLLVAIRGAGWLVHSRGGCWALFAGWIAGTIVMAGESPSGDTAIAAGGRQWAYLLIGVVLGAACSTFPILDRRSPTIERPPAD